MMRKRSAEPKESLIDALILDEMQKMTSLVEGEEQPAGSGAEGSMSLDPGDVRRHVGLGRRARQPQQPARSVTKPPSAPPPNKPRKADAHDAARPARSNRSRRCSSPSAPAFTARPTARCRGC